MKPRIHGRLFFWPLMVAAALFAINHSGRAQAPSQGEFGFWEARDDAGRKIVVKTAHYRTEIRPDQGAAVGSLQRGAPGRREFTAWHEGSMSGLLQEAHTANLTFEISEKETTEDKIILSFSGGKRDLKLHKTYEFYRDLPWFRVRLRFENRSSVPLAGRAAPRLENLLLPANGNASGRELYCLDRVTGARVMSSDLFRHRFDRSAVAGQDVGWVAVTDPAAMAGLGLVFPEGAPQGLSAHQTTHGETLISLSYERVPPGTSMESEALVVPFDGMTAVSAMHPAFMANVQVDSSAPNRLKLRLLALRWKLNDVSVVVRTYDSQGKELEAYDVVPLDVLEPGRIRSVRTRRPEESATPAWIVPEVRSEGKLVDAFSVPVRQDARQCPVDLPAPPQPNFRDLTDGERFLPGPGVSEAPPIQDRGFTVWKFQGTPPDAEVNKLDVHIASDESETVFLGVRALKPLDTVRATLATAGDDSGLAGRALASPAAFLWQIVEDSGGSHLMTRSFEAELEQNEVAWIAVTVDGRQLSPDRYGARLVIEADGKVLDIPLTVEVEEHALPPRSAFGMWYIADEPFKNDGLGAIFAALSQYRTSTLTWPITNALNPQEVGRLARRCLRAGMHMLGFSDESRGLSHELLRRLAEEGRAAPLAASRFAWMTSVPSVSPGADSLGERGFEPACVMSHLPSPQNGSSADLSAYGSLLVEDGPTPSRIPEFLTEERVRDEASIWLYLDLRGTNWRWAAPRIRGAAWAAVWQGLSGIAVRCPPPCTGGNNQRVIWHILRDACEEAALWREAQLASRRLEDVELADKKLQKQRALALQTFVSTIGEEQESFLRVTPREIPFRTVLRTVRSDNGLLPPISQFREAKTRMLEVLSEASRLVDLRARNLHWHGVPMQVDSKAQWSIVASGSETAWKQAGRLQKSIATLTGRTLDVSRQFPAMPERKESIDQLLWLVGPASEIDGVPESIIKALNPLEPPAVVRAPPFLIVNLPADWAALDTLVGTFSEYPTVYRPAADVK